MTRTSPDARPDVRRRTSARPPWVVRVVTAVVVVTVVAFGVLVWAAPRRQVPLPGPGATPAQVVRAYLDAVNARDFDTANAIDAEAGSDLGRFSRPGHTDAIRIYRVIRERSTEHVVVLADYHGIVGLNDRGFTGYYLRRGQDRRWHIVGTGVA